MVNSIIGGFAAILLGAAVAGATVFGLVSTQTAKPDRSPTSVEEPAVDYGSR